jgi:hypothetical protein
MPTHSMGRVTVPSSARLVHLLRSFLGPVSRLTERVAVPCPLSQKGKSKGTTVVDGKRRGETCVQGDGRRLSAPLAISIRPSFSIAIMDHGSQLHVQINSCCNKQTFGATRCSVAERLLIAKVNDEAEEQGPWMGRREERCSSARSRSSTTTWTSRNWAVQSSKGFVRHNQPAKRPWAFSSLLVSYEL